MREETQVQQQQAQTTQQQITEEQRRTEEIRKQAQAIRESQQWKETGRYTYNVGNDTFYVEANRKNTLEEQLAYNQSVVELHQRDVSVLGTIVAAQGEQKEKTEQQLATEEKLNAVEAERLGLEKQINAEKHNNNKYVSPLNYNETYKSMIANTLGVKAEEIVDYDSRLKRLNERLKQLNASWNNLSAADQHSPFGLTLRRDIQD
jgi:hypothetical protein